MDVACSCSRARITQAANDVVVFKLNTAGTPSLSLVDMLPTGGKGGASSNAGILQFRDDLGAVANFGSNSVSQLVRYDDFIGVGPTIKLAPGCVNPDSVALTKEHLFVVGTNCAESHAWPWGNVDGSVVGLTDPSAAQIAVGKSWAAVTLTVRIRPATAAHALWGAQRDKHHRNAPQQCRTLSRSGRRSGETFWDSLRPTVVDSFAIVNESRTVFPIAGPTPSYPSQRPLLGG